MFREPASHRAGRSKEINEGEEGRRERRGETREFHQAVANWRNLLRTLANWPWCGGALAFQFSMASFGSPVARELQARTTLGAVGQFELL